MKNMMPEQMAKELAGGLLSFPVTHFNNEGQFVEHAYREHCAWLLQRPIAGLFAAGGTGEFFSLTPEEVNVVVKAAVSEAAGRVPVIAGVGYGTAMAVKMARMAEAAGADGILLFPCYLINSSQAGIAAHIDAVCKATHLGVIVYNRDNGIVHEDTLADLCERNPNLVGFKDGHGDIELLTRIIVRMGDRLTYIGGLPTAETYALPYLQMGVTTYSSAIFNFMPDWAIHFYRSVCAGDRHAVTVGLRDFVLPYVALRNSGRGYAVSVVKAGMQAIGRPAGAVRPPLTDLTAVELDQLKALISSAQSSLKVA